MGNKEHTVFAETKCLAVFDATRKLHGMGKRERLLLQLAAILHDCGKYISMTAPGQCAYDIIMAAEILGIKHEERKILANVVKYNTTELDGYEEMHLPRKTCILIYKLIAMLRLVNAMDRSHKQKLSDAAFTLRDGKLVITTNTDQDISLERGMLEEKGRFFEEVFGVLPELKVRKK
jgi:exopolyphosphatase/guanosine-5'-triphosphate,3'-diphosphate pyrophosphatase